MLRLLINSLAKEFYQQHAGYFLMGFYLLFGIVESSQLMSYHKALLLAGVSSPVGILIVSVSWVLYCVKVYYFIKQRLGLNQYKFIFELGTVGKNPQLKVWLALYAVIMAPIIIYVFALIAITIYNELFISLICIVSVFAALVSGLSYLSYQSLTFGSLREEIRQINLHIKFKRPFFTWPILYLLNEQPLMLIMCKALSLLFFKCMLWMFADVGHDTRVLLVALLTSVLCHAVLIFTLLKFEISYLNFNKSLPISTSKRFSGWLYTSIIILLPEWILLIVSSENDVYAILNGFLFGLAGMLFLLTLLYLVKLNMAIYLRWLLFYFFISMWSILAHYYLLYSLVLLGSCGAYYLINFNRVDLKADE